MRLEDFLESNAQKRSYPKGAPILTAGKQAEEAYFIIDGTIEVHAGDDAVLARLGPGDLIGEMALLRYDEYTLSARAVTDAQLYIITPAMFQEQFRALHPLVKAVVDTLLERVNALNEVLIDIDTANKL